MQRKARRKTINPEFYIGYADDNESIEDIMQKFSYLDQIQAKNKENDNLTNDQFEDLYRKTANFKPDAIFVEHTEYSSYEDEDDAISVHSEDLRLQPVKRLKRGRPRLEADPAELAELESRFKRVKSYIQDPDAPLYVKLPNPIPRSWAKIIRPLGFDIKPMSCECKVIKADFSTFDFTNLGSDYQVCYMDPPLVNENESKLPGQLYISELAKYPIPAFVKSGFIFIWVKKQFTAKLLKIVENWGYRYIENIAWIKQNVDGSIAQEPSRLLNKSKTTCYVFRNVLIDLNFRTEISKSSINEMQM